MSLATPAKVAALVVASAALAIILMIAVPEHRLAFLESIPAKQFLVCLVALAVMVATVIIYYAVVVPTPPRFTATLICFIGPVCLGTLLLSANRPEYVNLSMDPAGVVVGERVGHLGRPAAVAVPFHAQPSPTAARAARNSANICSTASRINPCFAGSS
jgi:hypothetical protein